MSTFSQSSQSRLVVSCFWQLKSPGRSEKSPDPAPKSASRQHWRCREQTQHGHPPCGRSRVCQQDKSFSKKEQKLPAFLAPVFLLNIKSCICLSSGQMAKVQCKSQKIKKEKLTLTLLFKVGLMLGLEGGWRNDGASLIFKTSCGGCWLMKSWQTKLPWNSSSLWILTFVSLATNMFFAECFYGCFHNTVFPFEPQSYASSKVKVSQRYDIAFHRVATISLHTRL